MEYPLVQVKGEQGWYLTFVVKMDKNEENDATIDTVDVFEYYCRKCKRTEDCVHSDQVHHFIEKDMKTQRILNSKKDSLRRIVRYMNIN